jgi:hypothetical protein
LHLEKQPHEPRKPERLALPPGKLFCQARLRSKRHSRKYGPAMRKSWKSKTAPERHLFQNPTTTVTRWNPCCRAQGPRKQRPSVSVQVTRTSSKRRKKTRQHRWRRHQALRRGGLAIKDALEGSSGACGLRADIFVGTSGSGGILQGVGPKIAEITGISATATYTVAGLAAGFVGLGVAGLMASKHLATTGEEIKELQHPYWDCSGSGAGVPIRGKASGVNPDIAERMTKGLAQAADDDSAMLASRHAKN